MKKLYALFLLFAGTCTYTFAQTPTMCTDCGEFKIEKTPCLTPQQSNEIKSQIRLQQTILRQQGKLPPEDNSNLRTLATSFIWPLQSAAGITDPYNYGISNYVDENLSYPNQLLDYNCGNRTYDQGNGYNHAGTDIFTWPYPQLKQQNNEVEIIAAAPGIIIYKNDGSTDHNCAFCTSSCLWNAVYIQHTDGSVAWYGHMKNGSVTTKTIGTAVASGEKIGIVGSSGNSTGPHLHFEVYANAAQTQLVDPWQGACNNGSLYNAGLKWAAQKPYRENAINFIQTGHFAPSMGTCPNLESPNISDQFSASEIIYFTSFFHDQLTVAPASYSIIMPNNIVWAQWQHTPPAVYNASYWYWYFTLPANPVFGAWKFRVQIGSQVVEKTFMVNAATPVTFFKLNATASAPCKANVEWVTANEANNKGFHIQRSTDGTNFKNVGWKDGTGSSAIQKTYLFKDEINNTTGGCKKAFYRLQQEDLDGKSSISNTVAVNWPQASKRIILFPNPAKDNIVLQGEGLTSATLLDATGKVIAQTVLQNYTTIYPIINLSAGIYSLRFIHKDGTITTEHFIKY